MPTYEARFKICMDDVESYAKARELAENFCAWLNGEETSTLDYKVELTHLGVRYEPLEWPADINEGSSLDRTTTIHAADGTPLIRVNHASLRREDFDDS